MKKIKLHNGEYALVDDEDYPYINRFHWQCNIKKGLKYACTNIQREKKSVTIYMQEFLIPNDNFGCITFRNLNTLDYRKSNLTTINNGTRVMRGRKKKNCSSRYKWLSYNKQSGKYDVRIYKDGVKYYLGSYRSQTKGARIANEKAKELYGKLAYQNKL